MCFFNALSVNSTTLENRYTVDFPERSKFVAIEKGNGFAGISWPVITGEIPGKIEMQKWGLVPSWVPDAEAAKKISLQTLNARSETAFEKPSFKKSIRSQRCIVPSTGFFEWQHLGKKKIPWFIKIKGNEIFSIAGIWDEWADKSTGEIFRSFSILTTSANSIMAEIHNTKKRMPVILLTENEQKWLSQDIDRTSVIDLCSPLSDSLIDAFKIA